MTSHKDIWKFLQGELNDREKQVFHDWLMQSRKNHQDYSIFKHIWEQEYALQEYHLFDAQEEWKAISQYITESKPRKIKWRRWMGVAAVILLISSIFVWFSIPKEVPFYQEVYSHNQVYEILLPDSSMVHLAEHSYLRYFSRLDKKMTSRTLYLKGKAHFEVARDSTRPFIVESGGTGCRALGTKFNIEQKNSSLIQVENIEGLVRFYELTNENHAVLIRPGEFFTFDGKSFHESSPVKEIKGEKGEMLSIEDIINYLYTHFDGRFTTGPYGKFDLQKELRIDLEQDLEEIISALDSKTDMTFRKTCSNCYEIRSIVIR